MFAYQLKIEVKPYKQDELIDSMRYYLQNILKGKGCLNFSVYQNSFGTNTFIVIGEWKTRKDMEKHFWTKEFELLIGSARVLGETISMKIAEVMETGGYELAEEQVASK